MTRVDLMDRVRRSAAWLVLGLAVAGAAPVFAQAPKPASTAVPAPVPPAWEQLTAAQREQLVAPLRERWNANPAQRARMLSHARRWQQLTPEQRTRAHRGRDRLDTMSAEDRARARASFQHMRTLPEPERRALREKLRAMTPEQRAKWMQSQPARPPAP